MTNASTSYEHNGQAISFVTSPLNQGNKSLGGRINELHSRMLDVVPVVDRVACAIYDPKSDLLKTFINSTRVGEAISAYQFKLSDSITLRKMVETKQFRVINDLPAAIAPDTEHSAWVLKQGYQSSFTVPMFANDDFIGFIFFDSVTSHAFSQTVQRDLGIYSTLINMAITTELMAVRSVINSAKVARDFAHLRDFETGAHIERMARFSREIARGVAQKYNLSDEYVEQIFIFAPLHDIGKIGIPDKILLKPGKLDPDEYRIMQTHVEKGLQIVERVLGDLGVRDLPDSHIMKNIVGCHHELLDGSGYPNGIKGSEIPLEAQIVTVADVFDAISCARPYKTARSFESAIEELSQMANAGKLNKDCVAVIRQKKDEFISILSQNKD